MRIYPYIFLFCCLPVALQAQSYTDSIQRFREHYIQDLLADKRHVINSSQVKNISFFTADRSYCVWATFTETPGSAPFLIPTHSGKQKPYREYGTLTLYIRDTLCTLHVYKSVNPLSGLEQNDELFIPFHDVTNYDATFGGGRYIDLLTSDIQDNKVLLDFNKCYNPYCAYTEGYSCPIPPAENDLTIEIRAGEKMFQH